MTNLIIDDVCNLKCPYCFAQDYREGQVTSDHFLSLEAFEARLDFLERSGIEQVRLLGGEPTLHPNFETMIELVRVRGKKLLVFSNGLMPEKALTCLENLSPEDCTVIINIVEPAGVGSTRRIHQRQLATLRRLGKRASPGFTIYHRNFKPDFLLLAVTETNCQFCLRLGLAQPCLSGVNQYLYPHEYQVVGRKIIELVLAAAPLGISLSFDCGFVRCMFTEEELGILKTVKADFGWHCSPVLDIDLAGQALHCYPLFDFQHLALTDQLDASTLRKTFEALTRPYRPSGIFKACSGCHFKLSGECPGGCLATTMRRFRHAHFNVAVPLSCYAGQ